MVNLLHKCYASNSRERLGLHDKIWFVEARIRPMVRPHWVDVVELAIPKTK